MGMRIDGSQSAWATQNSSVSNLQQNQSGLKTVMADLKNGDLAGAQKAFSALNIDASKLNSNSPMAQLATALQNGDLSGAQKAAQGMGHHHHGGHGVQSTQTAANQDFMEMIAQSLATTLQSTQSSQSSGNSTTSPAPSTSASNTPQAMGSATDTTQALAAFMQNLMTALESQNSSSTGSGTTASSGSQPTLIGALGATPDGEASPQFNSYLQAMGGQIQNNLNSLMQQLSSSASPGTGNASPSIASNLQSSFASFINSMGGQADNSTLNTFLTNLQQNLQNGTSVGNLLNITA